MYRSRRSTPRSSSRQRGELLLGTLFALGIMAAAIVVFMKYESRRHIVNVAAAEGEVLSQFVIGLRGFTAAVQADPSLMPAAPRHGVAWLKAPGCGGQPTNPAEGYVPCHFTGGHFGNSYRTRFVHNPVTNLVEIRTDFVVPRFGSTSDSGSGSGDGRIMMAERLVRTALAGQANPNNGVFFSAFANVGENATAPHNLASGVPAGNTGRVVVVVTNAPSHDIFLRTDGTNKMLANLDMGEMSIADAMDGKFLGDVKIEEQLEVRAGIRVTEGVADLRDGVITPDVLIDGIGKLASEGIYDAHILPGGGTVPKPNCVDVGGTPGIYAVLQDTGAPASGDGDAVYQAKVDVIDSGSSWLVRPSLQSTRFELVRDNNDLVLTKQLRTVASSNARVLAMTRCR